MESIVADYSSSSESEEDNTRDFENENNLLKAGLFGSTADSDEDVVEAKNSSNREDENVNHYNHPDKLPKPSFNSTWDELSGVSTGVSVFANPFRAAEEAQKNLLEKHVKMTSAPKQTQVINGKQVCWNYRKGRCRFGHNCKFAHDSDLPAPVKKPEIETFEKQLETSNVIIGKPVRQKQSASTAESTSDDEDKQYVSKQKRKCGLGDGLVPSKKVMKMYNRQKDM